jgi:transcriptional regulator with XRE-family HTH domain
VNDEKIRQAVKQLRSALGMTQSELAIRVGRSLATIQRWEGVVSPKGQALVQLISLAGAGGQRELVPLFQDALAAELGSEVFKTSVEKGKPGAPPEEHEILDTIYYLAQKDEIPQAKKILDQWVKMTRRFRKELEAEKREPLADIQGLRPVSDFEAAAGKIQNDKGESK